MKVIDSINNGGMRMNAIGLFGRAGKQVDDWIAAGYVAHVETVRVGFFGWRSRYRVNIVDPSGRTIYQSSLKKQPVCDRFTRNFNAASLANQERR